MKLNRKQKQNVLQPQRSAWSMWIIAIAISFAMSAFADTNIDSTNKYAYGANIGWINAQGDVTNGMVVGQAFCSGYMYSANCGWIHLGDGSPANGVAYANNSATDYGVNHDGLGNLTGYAYGANIGWINFEQNYGKPKVDLSTGVLSGYIWGANVGWISLNTAQGYVKTLTMDSGPDTDADGIPDSWELSHTNVLGALSANTDSDGDGVNDYDEYLSDTDPFDAGDLLAIIDYQTSGSSNAVTWTVKMTREYTLQDSDSLTNGWNDILTAIPTSEPDMTAEDIGVTNSVQFYRVKASIPLSN